ncbi:hypothetical protein ATANTOWER_029188, partial [Ataeniobius toweri]|nr:hypothetical protein [Ataeniobius toweri]
GVDEDSVDIYEGLDLGNGSNTETSPAVSLGLKDSMDLYEDIVAEEQQHRESSYSEWFCWKNSPVFDVLIFDRVRIKPELLASWPHILIMNGCQIPTSCGSKQAQITAHLQGLDNETETPGFRPQ